MKSLLNANKDPVIDLDKITDDDSLFATADGKVVFGERNNHKIVSVELSG